MTTFLVDAYQNLQLDSGDRSVVLLGQISQQIAAMQISIAPADATLFKPSSTSQRILVPELAVQHHFALMALIIY